MSTITVSLTNPTQSKNILSDALTSVLTEEGVQLTAEQFNKITNITDIDTGVCAITATSFTGSAHRMLLLEDYHDDYSPAGYRTKEEGRIIFGDVSFGREFQNRLYRNPPADYGDLDNYDNILSEDGDIKHGTVDENQPYAVLIKKYDVKPTARADSFNEDKDIIVTTGIYIYIPKGYKAG